MSFALPEAAQLAQDIRKVLTVGVGRPLRGGAAAPHLEAVARELAEDPSLPEIRLFNDVIRSSVERLADTKWAKAAALAFGIAEETAAIRNLTQRRNHLAEALDVGVDQAKRRYEPQICMVLAEDMLRQIATIRGPQEQRPSNSSHALSRESSNDVSAYYYESASGDLDVGFFARTSTHRYIEALAALPELTLFLGAGVSADIGAPMHSELMPRLLKQYLKRSEDPDTAEMLSDVLAHAYGPTFLGSIVREIGRSLEDEGDHELASRMTTELSTRPTTGGLLLRSVGALAFALKAQGRPVGILTTNYDTKLDKQQRHIHSYFPALADYSFYIDDRATEPTARQVRVIYVNGRVDRPRHLVVGEADFFARFDGLTPDEDTAQWRRDTITNALTQTPCLFVGTSLSDPDLLQALATSKYQQRKYALVLAPDRERSADGSPLLMDKNGDEIREESDRLAVRQAIAQRFLHLGVVPIIVDFKQQVPQLLREVALRVQQGKKQYVPYVKRVDTWWKDMAPHLGFDEHGVPGERDVEVQDNWRQALAAIRDALYEELHLAQDQRDEMLQVEVWLRNAAAREMFLWATSESTWISGRTAHAFGIDANGVRFPQQKTFWDGITLAGPMPTRGWMRYHVSIPLTLHRAPWHHLPVGVASVFSSRYGSRKAGKSIGRLQEAAEKSRLDKIEAIVKERINSLLDPAE